jgi:hypothetical protein
MRFWRFYSSWSAHLSSFSKVGNLFQGLKRYFFWITGYTFITGFNININYVASVVRPKYSVMKGAIDFKAVFVLQ